MFELNGMSMLCNSVRIISELVTMFFESSIWFGLLWTGGRETFSDNEWVVCCGFPSSGTFCFWIADLASLQAKLPKCNLEA